MGTESNKNLYYVNRHYFGRGFVDNVDHKSRNATFHGMKLSVRGEYAIRALLVLALNYGEDVVRIQDISERQNIPKKFLEQILNDLKALGAVESRRGAAGGYRLARPPQNITLASVVRHVEGALAPVSCVSDRFYERCSCPDEARCAIRSVMGEVREAVVNIMERVTLSDLCERARLLESAPQSTLDYVI
jgi:Rrf2 family protein